MTAGPAIGTTPPAQRLLDVAQAGPVRTRCPRKRLRRSVTQPADPVLSGYNFRCGIRMTPPPCAVMGRGPTRTVAVDRAVDRARARQEAAALLRGERVPLPGPAYLLLPPRTAAI